MSQVSLTKLFMEANAYNDAFESAIMGNEAYVQKMSNNDPVIMATLNGLCEEFAAIEQKLRKIQSPLQMERFGLQAESTEVQIKIIDMVSSIAARNIGEDFIASLIPEEKRSAEISAAFKEKNAPTLAKIFAPKGL